MVPSLCFDAQHVQDYVVCRLVGRELVASEQCCVARARHDKRTPGLFKVEWKGDGFVGLCSKTYYCFGHTDKPNTNISTKNIHFFSKDVFMEVLQNRRSGVEKNAVIGLEILRFYNYVQERSSLTSVEYKPTGT